MYLFHCSLERTKHSFIFSSQSFHSLMAQYILLSNSFLAQRVSSPGFIAPLAWQRQLADLPFWFSNLCSTGPACKGPVYLSWAPVSCFTFFPFGDVISVILLKSRIRSLLKLSKYSLEELDILWQPQMSQYVTSSYHWKLVLLLFENPSQPFNIWWMFVFFRIINK